MKAAMMLRMARTHQNQTMRATAGWAEGRGVSGEWGNGHGNGDFESRRGILAAAPELGGRERERKKKRGGRRGKMK